jgi:putative transposase
MAGLSRHPWPVLAQRQERLLQRRQELKAEHPFWVYRRIGAYLRFVEKRAVNQKRGRRLLREHHLG